MEKVGKKERRAEPSVSRGRHTESSSAELAGWSPSFLTERPCLRDALLWSIPALVIGGALYLFIIRHTPLAFWSKDSTSFMNFADGLLSSGSFDLNAKRRWFYPIFLLLPHALPGATLLWVKLLQTVLTLCSVIAFGYIVRKTFVAWKLLLIPATLTYALHPHFIYYTGQVLAESVSVALLVLSIAGWTAWLARTDAATRFRPFLLFLVPIALFLLTKPAHRFVWPGLIIAFCLSGSWRWLRWPHFAALIGLMFLTSTVGLQGQGLRLLYSSVFPLTQLQGPSHMEYKNAIAELVKEARTQLPRYAFVDKRYKNFLEYPKRHPLGGNLWASLEDRQNRTIKDRLYRDLSLEGILHEPHLMFYVALQRVLGSHLRGVEMKRMQGDYLAARIALDYDELSHERPILLRKLYGLRSNATPDLESLQRSLAPFPDSGFDQWIALYGTVVEAWTRFLKPTENADSVRSGLKLSEYRPTLFGILLMAGAVLAFFSPYRPTLGAWTLALAIYLLLVFCVGSLNPRFLLPAEPLAILLTLLPLDVLCRWWWSGGGEEFLTGRGPSA